MLQSSRKIIHRSHFLERKRVAMCRSPDTRSLGPRALTREMERNAPGGEYWITRGGCYSL